MKQTVILIFGILFIPYANGQNTKIPKEIADWIFQESIPPPLIELWKTNHLENKYVITSYLNPFYLRGDFNGDGVLDYTVLIKETKTERKGILIYHCKTANYYVLGAGKDFFDSGNDLDWLNIWYVSGRGNIEPKTISDKPIQLIGEGIYLEKVEAASGVIYWDGKKYSWEQFGD